MRMLFMIGLLVWAMPAHADFKSKWDTCRNTSGQKQLAACIWLINSGKLSRGQARNAWLSRGIAHHVLKQYPAALLAYTQVIHIDPLYWQAYNNRGIIRALMKQYRGAIQNYDKVIKLHPRYRHVYFNRGVANGHLKQYRAAIQDYVRP